MSSQVKEITIKDGLGLDIPLYIFYNKVVEKQNQIYPKNTK